VSWGICWWKQKIIRFNLLDYWWYW
jgi:hypothetical protein